MRIKKGPRRFDLDAHLAADRRAYLWAERAMMYRGAGNFPQAQVAVDYVQHWMREIAALDAHKPHGRFELQAAHVASSTDRRGHLCFPSMRNPKECIVTARSQILSPAQVLLVED